MVRYPVVLEPDDNGTLMVTDADLRQLLELRCKNAVETRLRKEAKSVAKIARLRRFSDQPLRKSSSAASDCMT
jgi:hypothetical protein